MLELKISHLKLLVEPLVKAPFGNSLPSVSDPQFIITNTSLERENAFTLETITEGEIMNNVFPFGSDTDGRELPNGIVIVSPIT